MRLGIDLQQGFAQRRVQGINGTIARCCFDKHAVRDFQLDHSHGFRDLIALRVVPTLVDHAKAVELEEGNALAKLSAGIELERSISAVKG